MAKMSKKDKTSYEFLSNLVQVRVKVYADKHLILSNTCKRVTPKVKRNSLLFRAVFTLKKRI
jgi:hypothetical protein